MYDLARDYLAKQLEFIDALDGKIAVLVSMASGILGIAAAVFALHATSTKAQGTAEGLSGFQITMLVIGVGIYAWLAWAAGRAYFCRDWNIGPRLDGVWEQHRTSESDQDIKWGVAIDSWIDFDGNANAHDLKERALRKVFVGATLETLVLVVAMASVAA